MKEKILIDPTLMDEDKYDEHKIEEAAEILMEAEDIKKNSNLMSKVKEFLDNKGKKIRSLRDLKDMANNYSQKDDEKDEEGE